MPAKAAKEYDLGVVMAERQEWSRAIEYFDKAHRLAPAHPDILFSLGLAHARAGHGHGLRAMVWFSAYLMAAPDAQDRAEMVAEIQRQKKAVKARVRALRIKTRELALQMAKTEKDRESRDWFLTYIARWMAATGDIQGARKLLGRVEGRENRRRVLASIAMIRAKQGDIGGATAVLTVMPPPRRDAEGWPGTDLNPPIMGSIAVAQARSGNIRAALKTAQRALGDCRYDNVHLEIVVQALKAGRLDEAVEATSRIKHTLRKITALAAIAEAKAVAGDLRGAAPIYREARRALLRIDITSERNKEPGREVKAYPIGGPYPPNPVIPRCGGMNDPQPELPSIWLETAKVVTQGPPDYFFYKELVERMGLMLGRVAVRTGDPEFWEFLKAGKVLPAIALRTGLVVGLAERGYIRTARDIGCYTSTPLDDKGKPGRPQNVICGELENAIAVTYANGGYTSRALKPLGHTQSDDQKVKLLLATAKGKAGRVPEEALGYITRAAILTAPWKGFRYFGTRYKDKDIHEDDQALQQFLEEITEKTASGVLYDPAPIYLAKVTGDLEQALREFPAWEKRWRSVIAELLTQQKAPVPSREEIIREVSQTPGPMMLVPAGEFIMGFSFGTPREGPQRLVYLDAFYIDKYEVTNDQFRKAGMTATTGGEFNDPYKPVVVLTWFQARDYCAKVGKRLPTEAEWEKAARGTDGRPYPWGSNPWVAYAEESLKTGWSEDVGKYPSALSPYGAYDMLGNVSEWVADWYQKDYYRQAPERNPKGPSSGKNRVLRSGSRRITFRDSHGPSFSAFQIGFRCAKDAD
jgi:formylglycine-generating enzyme required for sulfatase activity